MNIELPSLSSARREALEKYLPVMLAIAIAWLFARGADGTQRPTGTTA